MYLPILLIKILTVYNKHKLKTIFLIILNIIKSQYILWLIIYDITFLSSSAFDIIIGSKYSISLPIGIP